MKLALCLEYPIDQHGGTEVLVRELIRGLSRRHQILLVSADDPGTFARSSISASVSGQIQWPVAFTVQASRCLAQQLVAAKPDLVHFHLGENHAWKSLRPWKSPLVATARTGLPVLTTNHGAFSVFSGCCPDRYPAAARLACLPPAWLGKQFTLAHLRAEVAVSRNDYDALRRWYWPMRNKFRRIYHSRLHETVPPPPNPGRRKVVLCAGTIGRRKGQVFLVEAFARLAPEFPDWQLVFLGRPGEAAEMRRIQQIIAQHRLEKQVQLPGPCSDNELRGWYRESAIFCMPSLYEGLGLTLQEAQFYGCAVVGTRCGGVTDLIQDGENGLLVPAGEAAPLAAALKRLMGDAALREKFSVRAPQSVLEKGMTADKMVLAYEKLYGEILNR